MKYDHSLRTKKSTRAAGASTTSRQASSHVKLPVCPNTVLGLSSQRRRVEAEVRQADALDPVGTPAAERPRDLAHVGLGVGAAVGAEREELHQLAAVVLVDRALAVVEAGQPDEHRLVLRDGRDERVEAAEPGAAEEVVLLEHELTRADAVVGRREPVVPDQRHPLDELMARSAPCGPSTTGGRGPRSRTGSSGAPSTVGSAPSIAACADGPGQRGDRGFEARAPRARPPGPGAGRSRRATAAARPRARRRCPV